MPLLTITKVVTYVDPVTSTPYDITGMVAIQCSQAYRDQFTLSSGSYTTIWNGLSTPFYGDFKYAFIKNTGAASCYLDMVSGTSHTVIEIPAGCSHDICGSGSFNDAGTPGLFSLKAKGNTTIEFDAFY